MSEKPNDSPAFRLRPRAEPKSYYSIRLEYSANPAAFTRERPRSSGIKRRSASSSKSFYSRTKQQQSNKLTAAAQSALRHSGGSYAPVPLPPPPTVKLENVVSKEDVEREERRKQLRREISQSITANTMISPFMQRLSVVELKPSAVYDQNYISMRIEKVIPKQQAAGASARAHMVCKCSRISVDDDEGDDKDSTVFLNVHLYDEYANESLLKVGKILNIAKFKTGPDTPTGSHINEEYAPGKSVRWLNFVVIIRYDEPDSIAPSLPGPPQPSLSMVPPQTSSTTATTTTTASCGGANQRKLPLIPFVSITDMIEQPTEPFVEMAPPSPLPLPNKDN